MMWKAISNNKGLTLIELVIALSLLSVVLVIGYNLYFFGNRTFEVGTDKQVAQREVQRIADYIAEELRYAYQLSLEEEPDEEPYHRIFIDGDDYVHAYDGTQVTSFNATQYTIHFNRVDPFEADYAGDFLRNVLSFTVSSNDTGYEVSSNVRLLNMPIEEIEGTAVDSESIYYLKTTVEDVLADPGGFDPPAGCFIATAAFGGETATPVILLRAFRDRHLLSNAPGRSFVSIYYEHSPALAAMFSQNAMLMGMVRVLLYPVVAFAYAIMYPFSLLATLLAAILFVLIWRNVCFRQRTL